MRVPRSKAASIILRDKKATAGLYAYARKGESGTVVAGGKKYHVEPVGAFITRMAKRKKGE